MEKQQLIKKITQKKEFSELPKKDVELAFEQFNKGKYLDEEKIKLTRDLLRRVFSAFTSLKLLSLKNKDEEWILKKHFSTRERLPYYKKLYEQLLNDFELGKKLTVIDLGAGVNGFSYKFLKEVKHNLDYVGIEAVGQLVELTNNYFIKNNIKGIVYHESLFDLEKIKSIIKKIKTQKVIFLFKTLDSLEMLERNYSKKLILEIVDLADRIIISFATRSMIKKTKFKVNREWIINFLKDNFNMLDDFELGSERYIVFCKK